MGLRIKRSIVSVVLVASLTILLCPSDQPLAQPVIFGIHTSTGTDTLPRGATNSIIFTVDPNGAAITALTVPVLISYTNGNLIGQIEQGQELIIPPELECLWCPPINSTGTDPDTLVYGFLGFGGMMIDTAMEIFRIRFTPTDTGQIHTDSIFVPPANHLSALDMTAVELPIVWSPITVHVIKFPCIVEITGDVNESGSITSADIISTVGTVFKDPRFDCFARGDVNCDGLLNSTDIILMVNRIFKGGAEFCDVCPLLWDGTWVCD